MVISNRSLERAVVLAESLSSFVRGRNLQINITASSWQSSEYKELLSKCQLIVNCTSMGMRHSAYESQSPLALSDIPRGALVYDLVYNPPETPLLRLAREAGANVLGGLQMLVYQGAAGFELWVEKKAPIDIMFQAARKALY
jgi:shikimate dehydrogenase